MQNKKLLPHAKIHPLYLALLLTTSLLMATCHERKKQEQRDNLDTMISNLDKEINESKNLHTAHVPQHLQQTQSRYISTSDSLDKKFDTIDKCMMQNEDLLLMAFNNYATRIGRNFQLNKFLSASDITIFQKHVANMDTTDYIHQQARKRILNNNGSLHDLSYFMEMFDLDSINSELTNKLTWNFYPDTSAIYDSNACEISILNFENTVLNNALRTETKLLEHAWIKNKLYDELRTNDSVRMSNMATAPDSISRTKIKHKHDSIKEQIISGFGLVTPETPNFEIPEFDSIRAQYLHNDSVVNEYENTWNTMIHAKDTLEQYRKNIIRRRDSLAQKRGELER